jgi:hypothetical protein
MKFKFLPVTLLFLAGCVAQNKSTLKPGAKLHLIGAYNVPLKAQFKGTTVGGLSGIDYDAKKDLFYIISDDGSKINPARYYTAKVRVSNKGIDSVEFLSVSTLLNENDSTFSYSAIDPESIRFYPKTNQVFWSSEGEKIVRKNEVLLQDPSVNISDLNGRLKDRFQLPPNMHLQAIEKGPRSNGSFEGFTFSDDYKTAYVNVEEPLSEDGPRAGGDDSSALTRIIKFDVATRKPLAQYVYEIDPIAYPAVPANAFKINGAAEILWVNKDQLLVIERSFSSGRQGCVIKLYLADLSHAVDVTSVDSLKVQKQKPVPKKLLLNMDSLGIPIYNIEGVTFGPQLPNGHKTLLFVADDNFSPLDKTQFLLFDIE